MSKLISWLLAIHICLMVRANRFNIIKSFLGNLKDLLVLLARRKSKVTFQSYIYVQVFISDPFEQWNRAALLTTEEKSYLHDTLSHLKGCRGARQCTISPPRKHRKHRPNLGQLLCYLLYFNRVPLSCEFSLLWKKCE